MVPQHIIDQLDKVILTAQNLRSGSHAEALDREKGILLQSIASFAEGEATKVASFYEQCGEG